MKIAFICGSCAPGSNGVGDYTRTLAKNLCFENHDCLIVSINENSNFVDSSSSLLNSNSSTNGRLTIVRFPSYYSWSYRTKEILKYFRNFQPDFISLQYVPYSFDKKGIPLRLIFVLLSLRNLGQWHVMVHELSVDLGTNIKYRILGSIQQLILYLLLHIIKPLLINVSNHYNALLLSFIGCHASVLPIFSNIPKYDFFDLDLGSQDSTKYLSNWNIVFFGSIHKEWNPLSLFFALESVVDNLSISSIKITILGNSGVNFIDFLGFYNYKLPSYIQVHQTGWLDAKEISWYLSTANWGVTSTPSHLLGKSGTVAAMLEHGLRVIVPRIEKINGSWHNHFVSSDYFIPLDSNFQRNLLLSIQQPVKKYTPPNIAKEFVRSLQNIK